MVQTFRSLVQGRKTKLLGMTCQQVCSLVEPNILSRSGQLTLILIDLSGARSELDQPSTTSTSNPADQGPEEQQVYGPLPGPAGSAGLALSVEDSNGHTTRPESPYSIQRAMIRDLTLPSIPDFDIPLTPPGSPRASTTAKFSRFLELKQQGVHFNEKLAKSSALKNPSLLQKLMNFAGISEHDQYASSLPKEAWDPASFPPGAYKEELTKSQQELLKKKEDEKRQAQRQAVEFVPASGESYTVAATSTATVAAAGTRAADGGSGLGRSAAERVMAGLDRERSSTPNLPNGEKRSTLARRTGR